MIKIAKISIAMVFINIYIIFTYTGTFIPNGTLIFGMIGALCVLIDSNQEKFFHFTYRHREIKALLLFLVLSFLGSMVFAYSRSTAIRGLIDFAEKLVFVFVIYYICAKEKSIQFPLVLFLGIGAVVAFYILRVNEASIRRIELNDNIGKNGLGNLMVFTFFSIVYLLKDKKGVLIQLIKVAGCITFLYIISLTGSRKSLYAVIIFLILCFFWGKKTITGKKLLLAILMLPIIPLIYPSVKVLFTNTAMYARLFGQYASHANESNEGRVQLYFTAMRDFLRNPLFGIGFKNFAYQHGAYTHSVYAEILACCGLSGFFTYFSSYYQILKNLFRKGIRHLLTTEQDISLIYIRSFFVAFLFIGIGLGHIYDNISMCELGIFLGYITIIEENWLTGRGGEMT